MASYKLNTNSTEPLTSEQIYTIRNKIMYQTNKDNEDNLNYFVALTNDSSDELPIIVQWRKLSDNRYQVSALDPVASTIDENPVGGISGWLTFPQLLDSTDAVNGEAVRKLFETYDLSTVLMLDLPNPFGSGSVIIAYNETNGKYGILLDGTPYIFSDSYGTGLGRTATIMAFAYIDGQVLYPSSPPNNTAGTN